MLNPRRGGSTSIDFLRPCFTIANWRGSEVDVWKSLNGLDWTKLEDTDFVSSFEPFTQTLRLALLFDLTQTTYLAFFDIDGRRTGIGWTLEKNPVVPVGWDTEDETGTIMAMGWSNGSVEPMDMCAGYDIQGALNGNIPCGWTVKEPVMSNLPLGYQVAAAQDGLLRIGFQIGEVHFRSISAGAAIMGLAEFPIGLAYFDTDELSAEAAVRKQVTITLSGTTPQELE
jgi:hypothetical protein